MEYKFEHEEPEVGYIDKSAPPKLTKSNKVTINKKRIVLPCTYEVFMRAFNNYIYKRLKEMRNNE